MDASWPLEMDGLRFLHVDRNGTGVCSENEVCGMVTKVEMNRGSALVSFDNADAAARAVSELSRCHWLSLRLCNSCHASL